MNGLFDLAFVKGLEAAAKGLSAEANCYKDAAYKAAWLSGWKSYVLCGTN